MQLRSHPNVMPPWLWLSDHKHSAEYAFLLSCRKAYFRIDASATKAVFRIYSFTHANLPDLNPVSLLIERVKAEFCHYAKTSFVWTSDFPTELSCSLINTSLDWMTSMLKGFWLARFCSTLTWRQTAKPFGDIYLRLWSALSSLNFPFILWAGCDILEIVHGVHRLWSIMLMPSFYSYAEWSLEYRIICIGSYIVVNLHFNPLSDLWETNPHPISYHKAYFSALINDLQNNRSGAFFHACFSFFLVFPHKHLFALSGSSKAPLNFKDLLLNYSLTKRQSHPLIQGSVIIDTLNYLEFHHRAVRLLH